jgi:hypothetical protein
MLEFILNHATRYELELLGEALRKRMERETSLGQMDFQYMARTMAEGFTKQMGMDTENIEKMSRRLVSEMIQKEAPGITEKEINTLLDTWVPGKEAKKASALPKEMLLAMITQFVAYSSGEMSDKEKKMFPEGWAEKYWNAFQPEIQILVKNFLTDKIGKNEFWGGIREYLNAMK